MSQQEIGIPANPVFCMPLLKMFTPEETARAAGQTLRQTLAHTVDGVKPRRDAGAEWNASEDGAAMAAALPGTATFSRSTGWAWETPGSSSMGMASILPREWRIRLPRARCWPPQLSHKAAQKRNCCGVSERCPEDRPVGWCGSGTLWSLAGNECSGRQQECPKPIRPHTPLPGIPDEKLCNCGLARPDCAADNGVDRPHSSEEVPLAAR